MDWNNWYIGFVKKTVFYNRFPRTIRHGSRTLFCNSGLCRVSCVGGEVESCLRRLCACCPTARPSSPRRQDKTGTMFRMMLFSLSVFWSDLCSLARNLGTVLLCPDEHFFYKSFVLPNVAPHRGGSSGLYRGKRRFVSDDSDEQDSVKIFMRKSLLGKLFLQQFCRIDSALSSKFIQRHLWNIQPFFHPARFDCCVTGYSDPL